LVFEAFVDIFGGQIVRESSSSDGRLSSDSSRLPVGSWLLLGMSFIAAKSSSWCQAAVIADLSWSLRLSIRSALCSGADWFQKLFVQLSVLCDIVRCL
jgi:hypothetical protein